MTSLSPISPRDLKFHFALRSPSDEAGQFGTSINYVEKESFFYNPQSEINN
jgi:hypothetical protein